MIDEAPAEVGSIGTEAAAIFSTDEKVALKVGCASKSSRLLECFVLVNASDELRH